MSVRSLTAIVLVAVVAAAALSSCGGSSSGTPAGGRVAPGRTVTAPVIRAVDGDTILVRLDGRAQYVRYIGVDTPETVKPGTPVQCFGPQASAFDHRLVEGKTVRLTFDRELKDVYGRLLAYVHVGPTFVNAELVRRGLARTLPIAPNTAHETLFSRLAQRAGRAGRGLWSRC